MQKAGTGCAASRTRFLCDLGLSHECPDPDAQRRIQSTLS
jgi:hypothetical protein